MKSQLPYNLLVLLLPGGKYTDHQIEQADIQQVKEESSEQGFTDAQEKNQKKFEEVTKLFGLFKRRSHLQLKWLQPPPGNCKVKDRRGNKIEQENGSSGLVNF